MYEEMSSNAPETFWTTSMSCRWGACFSRNLTRPNGHLVWPLVAVPVDLTVQLVPLGVEAWLCEVGIRPWFPRQVGGCERDGVVFWELNVPRDESGRDVLASDPPRLSISVLVHVLVWESTLEKNG